MNRTIFKRGKPNIILIIGMLLFNMALIDCHVVCADTLVNNVDKVVTYATEQGFTWQQMKNASLSQWMNHCVLAGIDPNDLRGTKHSLRRALIKKKKQIPH